MKCLLRLFLVVCFIGSVSVQAGDIGTVSCTATKSDGTEFVPSWGKVIIDEDQYTRYVIQYMYWDKWERLFWLNSLGSSTFESDVLFYNYDGFAYGKKPTGYWSSDLPGAYVDTGFQDGDENAVTVGSAQSVLLTHGKVYYTVTRMTNGGGDGSWVKLSAQRGRQVPAGCYSTWCSFGCVTNSNYITLPYQDHFTAPGCKKYNWLWNTTVRSNC